MHTLTQEENILIDSERLIRRIPFFNNVYEESAAQFESLMELADIVQYEANETIIRKGDNDMVLYFLLKGLLSVFIDENSTESINAINPGEVFGILSMVTATSRSAFIKANDNNKNAILFKLDFKYISDDSIHSQLSLPIKLIFYRMAVHNIRWTLELNKMSDPNHCLVDAIRKLPLHRAEKDSEEELNTLKQQAKDLSDILFKWNDSSF